MTLPQPPPEKFSHAYVGSACFEPSYLIKYSLIHFFSATEEPLGGIFKDDLQSIFKDDLQSRVFPRHSADRTSQSPPSCSVLDAPTAAYKTSSISVLSVPRSGPRSHKPA